MYAYANASVLGRHAPHCECATTVISFWMLAKFDSTKDVNSDTAYYWHFAASEYYSNGRATSLVRFVSVIFFYGSRIRKWAVTRTAAMLRYSYLVEEGRNAGNVHSQHGGHLEQKTATCERERIGEKSLVASKKVPE